MTGQKTPIKYECYIVDRVNICRSLAHWIWLIPNSFAKNLFILHAGSEEPREMLYILLFDCHIIATAILIA